VNISQSRKPIRFAVVGIDHRHIYELVAELQSAGALCVGYCTQTSDPKVAQGLKERFPALPSSDDPDQYLEDPGVDLIVTAAVPSQRAAIAVKAMRNGKDVLADKPGVTSFAQLEQVRAAVAETGRIFSICFSERHLVPAVEHALDLVRAGAIGEPVQTLSMGPHRLNAAIRPAWFFEAAHYGGILVDIASHQIDQFLLFTNATDVCIAHSHVGHYGSATRDNFQDFGEIILQAARHRGYVRVDWFTPDGMPTWGDGRLFVTGTQGCIEIRKYLDIEGRPGTDHLFLADSNGTRHIDCGKMPIRYFQFLLEDIANRTAHCMAQEHVFKVCELSLQAQAQAQAHTPQGLSI
jgi:predicted dehydrogenase